MIHVSGQGVAHTELVSDFSWFVAIALDTASRWSVPVFVMVSGALILGSTKIETLGEFYRKRAARIGVPLLFWSITFLLWRHFYVPEPDLGFTLSLRYLFFGIPAFHLYFLYLILGLYLLTPMFRHFVRHASRAELWATTATALIFTALSLQLRMHFGGWIQGTAFDYFVPYVVFFLAGHAIANTQLPTCWHRRFRVIACLLLPISLAISIIGVWYGGKDPVALNRTIEIYYQFPYPTVMVMSLCVFSLFVDLYRNPGPVRRRIASICAWIAPAAFGIYLIHPIFLWEIFKRHGIPVSPNTLIACPTWTLALFVVSLLATKLIQLIPFVRRTVG